MNGRVPDTGPQCVTEAGRAFEVTNLFQKFKEVLVDPDIEPVTTLAGTYSHFV